MRSCAGNSSLRWFTRKNTLRPSLPRLAVRTLGSSTSHSTDSMTLYALAVASAMRATFQARSITTRPWLFRMKRIGYTICSPTSFCARRTTAMSCTSASPWGVATCVSVL